MVKEKILLAAKAVCLAADGVGKNRNYKVGAILFKKGHIYAAKSNSYKTHPYLLHYSEYPYLHAESACILSHGLDNCWGLDLLVTRMLRSGSFSMAHPCASCQSLIKDVGIKNIYYSDWKGRINALEL